MCSVIGFWNDNNIIIFIKMLCSMKFDAWFIKLNGVAILTLINGSVFPTNGVHR
jgi:hypothetical protein